MKTLLETRVAEKLLLDGPAPVVGSGSRRPRRQQRELEDQGSAAPGRLRAARALPEPSGLGGSASPVTWGQTPFHPD